MLSTVSGAPILPPVLLACGLELSAGVAAATEPVQVAVFEQQCVEGGRPSEGANLRAQQGVALTIEPGWAISWKHPGGVGFGTTIDLSLSIPDDTASITWPAPEMLLSKTGAPWFAYQGRVFFPVHVELPSAPRGVAQRDVVVDVAWVACREICVPGSARLELTASHAAGDDSAGSAVRSCEGMRHRLPASIASVHGRLEEREGRTSLNIDVGWRNDPGRLAVFPNLPVEWLIKSITESVNGSSTVHSFELAPRGRDKAPSEVPHAIGIVFYDPAAGRGFELEVLVSR